MAHRQAAASIQATKKKKKALPKTVGLDDDPSDIDFSKFSVTQWENYAKSKDYIVNPYLFTRANGKLSRWAYQFGGEYLNATNLADAINNLLSFLAKSDWFLNILFSTPNNTNKGLSSSLSGRH